MLHDLTIIYGIGLVLLFFYVFFIEIPPLFYAFKIHLISATGFWFRIQRILHVSSSLSRLQFSLFKYFQSTLIISFGVSNVHLST